MKFCNGEGRLLLILTVFKFKGEHNIYIHKDTKGNVIALNIIIFNGIEETICIRLKMMSIEKYKIL